MKNVTPSIGLLSDTAWNKAVTFHGHACPGLALGARLAVEGVRALGLDDSFLGKGQEQEAVFSPDEELVCVAETDSCALDAFQILLGCTMGKGNLLLKPRGKSAFTLYHRPTRQAVRLLWGVFSDPDQTMSREDKIKYFLSGPAEKLFSIRESAWTPPDRATISGSFPCSLCGEMTAEFAVRQLGGKYYCQDCFPDPTRIL